MYKKRKQQNMKISFEKINFFFFFSLQLRSSECLTDQNTVMFPKNIISALQEESENK